MPESPYLGETRAQFAYVRSFAFRGSIRQRFSGVPSTGVNPYVNSWFVTRCSDVGVVLMTRRHDDLCSRGGFCILSTHLGRGLCGRAELTQMSRGSRYGDCYSRLRSTDHVAGQDDIPVLAGLRRCRLNTPHCGTGSRQNRNAERFMKLDFVSSATPGGLGR
jgi:hypothetical protein